MTLVEQPGSLPFLEGSGVPPVHVIKPQCNYYCASELHHYKKKFSESFSGKKKIFFSVVNDRNTIQTSLDQRRREFVQRITKVSHIIKGKVE